MTRKDMLYIYNAFTPNEIADRNSYFKKQDKVKEIPPMPKDAHYCPLEMSPQATYRICDIAPYRHERYLVTQYHDHSHIELMYLFDGHCLNTIEGTTSLLDTGDVLILPPGVFHLPEINDDNTIMVNLLIKTDVFNRISDELPLDSSRPLSNFVKSVHYDKSYPKYYLQRNSDPAIKDLMLDLSIEYFENKPCNGLIIESLLLQILCVLFRTNNEKTTLAPLQVFPIRSILPIMQFIYDNFRSVNLAMVSEKFHYTPQHICRLIKKYTGRTFSKHLLEIRIHSAKQLMINTNFSITHIAALSGFDCLPHFHRIFNAENGMTPLQFRKKHQSHQSM